MDYRIIIIALVATVPFISLNAQQRVTPPPPAEQPRELQFTHAGNRGGFYIGVGSLTGEIGDFLELSGGVIEGGYGFFLGISDNLAANFAMDIQYAPETDVAGSFIAPMSPGNLFALNTQLGISYFFLPGEFFLSAGLLFSVADFGDTSAEFTTGFGPGFTFSAGKEFRLSNRVLVGTGYRFRYASMAVEDASYMVLEDERLRLMSHSIYMSLTWFSRR